jgi:hypothetical protein
MKVTISQLRTIVEEAILDEKKKSKSKRKAASRRKSAKKSRRKKRKAKKSTAKRDACYHKVKARYDVWPSAYASGALVKCRKVGAANWGNSKKESLSRDKIKEIVEEEFLKIDEKKKKKRKLTKKPSSETSLRDWFGRKGAKGKKGGWVDCNTCRKDKKTGRKKCSACGRSTGEKRAKYPSCRPTPSACGEKSKSWGKKSKAGKKG